MKPALPLLSLKTGRRSLIGSTKETPIILLKGRPKTTVGLFSIKSILLMSWSVMLASFTLSAQTIRYVKPGGAGDGSSWSQASEDLQSIINASAANDEIWVAAGIYTPTRDGYGNTSPANNRMKTFLLKNGVAIYGGFSGNETERTERNIATNVSTLSGDLGGDDIGFTNNGENSYNVVLSLFNPVTTVLDGFTIKGGNGNVFIVYDITISGVGVGRINTVIGGGIFASNSVGNFANCIITGNTVTGNGGGVDINQSNVRFTNCLFSGNTGGSGGALYNNASYPTLLNCTFRQNIATFGGAVYNASSSPVLTNCAFLSNSSQDGSGLTNSFSNPALVNCTFYGNTAINGVIYNTNNSNPIIKNCIIWGNSSLFVNLSGSPVVSYSVVQGGWGGTGNLNKDPLFVNAANGNVRLQPCSPAINTGNDNDNESATDLDGNPRKVSTIDMGAYEYQSTVAAPEINIQGNGIDIADGDLTPSITDFGLVATSGSIGRTFTIQNTGNAALAIAGITSSNAKFVVSNIPASVAAGNSVSFTVTYTPTTPNTTDNATITIENDDCSEAVYDFAVKGMSDCSVSFPATTTNNSLHFDGTNDFVTISNCGTTTPLINGGDALTIEYWFKGTHLQSAVRFQPAASSTFVVAGWTGDNSTTIPRHILSNDGGINGLNVAASTALIYDGNWHHIAMTWQRNTVNGFKTFFDGQLVAQRNSSSTALPVISSGIFLGIFNGLSEVMNGSLDEVRIWNVSRTPEEIAASTTCGMTVPQTGLLLYYKFDHGTAGGTNSGITLLQNLANPGTYPGFLNNFALTGNTSNWIASTSGTTTFYQDSDGDGFGNAAQTAQGCSAPEGYVSNSDDCNDNSALEKPGQVWYKDADNDGYAETGAATLTQCSRPLGYKEVSELTAITGDCNDAITAINPGATEVCDGVDNNCNGQMDEGGTTTFYLDADDDGFGNPDVSEQGCSAPEGYVSNSTDCNDGNSSIWQTASLYIDADGDGYDAGSTMVCYGAAIPPGYSATTAGADCDDARASIHPGATEICGNGIDDNCNGQTDEGCNTTTCDNATNFTTTGITTSSATLNWEAPVNPDKWQLQYKSTKPGSKWMEVAVGNTARSVTINGLRADQPYQWHIRALCTKSWTLYSDAITFKTLSTKSDGVSAIEASKGERTQPLSVETLPLRVEASPNPSASSFTLRIRSNSEKEVILTVFDALGRKVDIRTGVPASSILRLGENYRPGIYYVQLVQDGKIVMVRLIKQRN